MAARPLAWKIEHVSMSQPVLNPNVKPCKVRSFIIAEYRMAIMMYCASTELQPAHLVQRELSIIFRYIVLLSDS